MATNETTGAPSGGDDPNDAVTLPPYAGDADPGLRDSLPATDPMLGDAADIVDAECGKLENLLGVTVGLLDDGDLAAVQQRWYGIVRELLEFEAALDRVVAPAVAGTRADETGAADVMLDLRRYDGLTAEVDPDDVRRVCVAAAALLEQQQSQLVPALRSLEPAARRDLGEDLREVMG